MEDMGAGVLDWRETSTSDVSRSGSRRIGSEPVSVRRVISVARAASAPKPGSERPLAWLSERKKKIVFERKKA